ncbi:MAG: MarR family transcriptional regulator [Sphingobacteriales bacterium]|nr:MarR family transcriptional regulator [Nocardioides sp.]MDB5120846.1 MarR family transcriptional regulator [Sphingobacteriales bacterium]
MNTLLSPKEKSLLTYVSNHPGCSSGEIAKKLLALNPTVKRLFSELLIKKLIVKHGNGPCTNYSIAYPNLPLIDISISYS